jgi:hypothetical protein
MPDSEESEEGDSSFLEELAHACMGLSPVQGRWPILYLTIAMDGENKLRREKRKQSPWTPELISEPNGGSRAKMARLTYRYPREVQYLCDITKNATGHESAPHSVAILLVCDSQVRRNCRHLRVAANH